MSIKNKFLFFYGDKGYKFDAIISIIFVILIIYFQVDLTFVRSFINSANESTISFFGIIVGFLLTTFSLLFLYNPENSPKLMKVRNLPAYKNMLYAFLSTAFILIILTVLLFAFKILVNIGTTANLTILFLIIFSFLRIMKCIFYLFAIIKLS